MAIKTISKFIEINAPATEVWDIIFHDDTYRVWREAFTPGSYAATDWQTGSQIMFLDATKNGLLADVTESNPPHMMAIQFRGAVSDGKPDYDSSYAHDYHGAKEIYRLNEESGTCRLEIAADVPERYYLRMSESWDKALLKIKELAETR